MSFALRKVAPIYASAAENKPVFMIWHRVLMVPLLVWGGGRFVTVFDKLVGNGKISYCVFFTEIGRIAGDVKYHVSGIIAECVVGLGCHIV